MQENEIYSESESNEFKAVSNNFDDTDLIKLICESNGWKESEFYNMQLLSRELQLFMICLPSISWIIYFKNLVTLKLVHVGLKELDGRHFLGFSSLKEIWLAENDLCTIKNGFCRNDSIQKLYIYMNRFTNLDSFTELKNLEIIVADQNEINTLSSLSSFSKLKILTLARNKLHSFSIGEERCVNSFERLSELQELDVSGNWISSLREILFLSPERLPYLRKLSFSTALHGANPVCGLRNYRLFSVSLFAKNFLFSSLDGISVSEREKHIAAVLYESKNHYYHWRSHLLYGKFLGVVDEVYQEVSDDISTLMEDLRLLYSAQSIVAAQLHSLDEKKWKEDNCRIDMLKQVEKNVSNELIQSFNTLNDYFLKFNEFSRFIFSELRLHLLALLLEQESCSNIRIECLKPSLACSDAGKNNRALIELLIHNRFTHKTFLRTFPQLNLSGISIARVSRIENIELKGNFNQRVQMLADITRPSFRQAVEYLFLTFRETNVGECDISSVFQYGARSSSVMHTDSDGSSTFTLVNSLFLADQRRLKTIVDNVDFKHGIPLQQLHTRLIVCKVFLAVELPESPSLDMGDKRNQRAWSLRHPLAQDPEHVEYCCHDPDLVLPEYIVDVFYSSRAINVPPEMTSISVDTLYSDTAVARQFAEVFCAMERNRRFQSPGSDVADAAATARAALATCSSLGLTTNTDTAKQGNSITGIKGTNSLYLVGEFSGEQTDSIISRFRSLTPKLRTQLLELDLSNNDMRLPSTFLRDIALSFMSLEILTLSCNKISGFPDHDNDTSDEELLNNVFFPSLAMLDLSCNEISSSFSLRLLKRLCPKLSSLDLSFNPLFVPAAMLAQTASGDERDDVELLVFQFLPESVVTLNGEDVVCWMNRLLKRQKNSDDTRAFSQFSRLKMNPPFISSATGSAELGSVVTRHASFDVMHQYAICVDSFDVGAAALYARLNLKTPPYRGYLIANRFLSSLKAFNSCLTVVQLRNCLITGTITLPPHVHFADLRFNYIEGFSELPISLTYLDVAYNSVRRVSDLLGTSLETAKGKGENMAPITIPLEYLDIEHNSLCDLKGLSCFGALSELYMQWNSFAAEDILLELTGLPKLQCLRLTVSHGGELSESQKNKILIAVQTLRAVNEWLVTPSDVMRARVILDHQLTVGRLRSLLAPTPENEWTTAITTLDLSNCTLEGPLDLLQRLPALRRLELQHNLLTSLRSLTCCTFLEILNVAYNQLGWNEPASVALSTAETFCVSETESSKKDGEIFTSDFAIELTPKAEDLLHSLEQLSGLVSLSLEGNKIPSLPPGLCLPQLKFLNVSNNCFTFIGRGFGRFRRLKELILDKNNLTALENEQLKPLRSLRRLSCADNVITRVGSDGGKGSSVLPHLTHACFARNALSDIKQLGRWVKDMQLVSLDISGNRISVGPFFLSTAMTRRLPKLQCLNGVRVTRACVRSVHYDPNEDMIETNDPTSTTDTNSHNFMLDAPGGEISSAAADPVAAGQGCAAKGRYEVQPTIVVQLSCTAKHSKPPMSSPKVVNGGIRRVTSTFVRSGPEITHRTSYL